MSKAQSLTSAHSTGANRQKWGTVALNGRAAVGYIYTAGNAINAETITMTGFSATGAAVTRIYEFDTAAAPGSVVAGNVRIDVNADQTPDYACAALAAAINGDADRLVEALVWVGNTDVSSGILLVSRNEDDYLPTLVEATTNFVVSAAAMVGANVGYVHGLWFGQYLVTAADVTALALAAGNEVVIGGVVTAAAQPVLAAVTCMVGGVTVKDLATVTFTVRNVIGQHYVIVADDGAAVLAAGDVLTFLAGY
jgi:hypothetical protein